MSNVQLWHAAPVPKYLVESDSPEIADASDITAMSAAIGRRFGTLKRGRDEVRPGRAFMREEIKSAWHEK
jgi:hypothetical protein